MCVVYQSMIYGAKGLIDAYGCKTFAKDMIENYTCLCRQPWSSEHAITTMLGLCTTVPGQDLEHRKKDTQNVNEFRSHGGLSLKLMGTYEYVYVVSLYIHVSHRWTEISWMTRVYLPPVVSFVFFSKALYHKEKCLNCHGLSREKWVAFYNTSSL